MRTPMQNFSGRKNNEKTAQLIPTGKERKDKISFYKTKI